MNLPVASRTVPDPARSPGAGPLPQGASLLGTATDGLPVVDFLTVFLQSGNTSPVATDGKAALANDGTAPAEPEGEAPITNAASPGGAISPPQAGWQAASVDPVTAPFWAAPPESPVQGKGCPGSATVERAPREAVEIVPNIAENAEDPPASAAAAGLPHRGKADRQPHPGSTANHTRVAPGQGEDADSSSLATTAGWPHPLSRPALGASPAHPVAPPQPAPQVDPEPQARPATDQTQMPAEAPPRTNPAPATKTPLPVATADRSSGQTNTPTSQSQGTPQQPAEIASLPPFAMPFRTEAREGPEPSTPDLPAQGFAHEARGSSIAFSPAESSMFSPAVSAVAAPWPGDKPPASATLARPGPPDPMLPPMAPTVSPMPAPQRAADGGSLPAAAGTPPLGSGAAISSPSIPAQRASTDLAVTGTTPPITPGSARMVTAAPAAPAMGATIPQDDSGPAPTIRAHTPNRPDGPSLPSSVPQAPVANPVPPNLQSKSTTLPDTGAPAAPAGIAQLRQTGASPDPTFPVLTAESPQRERSAAAHGTIAATAPPPLPPPAPPQAPAAPTDLDASPPAASLPRDTPATSSPAAPPPRDARHGPDIAQRPRSPMPAYPLQPLPDPGLPTPPRGDTGTGQPTQSTPQPAPPTTLPDLLTRQILPNIATPGAVSVTLSPVELGTLRFEVTPRGDGLHLHLTVDTPATLDLLRRQGDQILAELRQAGFANASLSFAASDGQGGNQTGNQQGGQTGGPPQGAPRTDDATLAASPPEGSVGRDPRSRPAALGTLDLRL